MAKTNDNSTDPRDWTNRKLIAAIRAGLNVPTVAERVDAKTALDELERRTVRSSSRN